VTRVTAPSTPEPRSSILSIPGYTAGSPAPAGSYKLSSNENPYPPLPGVVDAAAAALETLNRYPDVTAAPLRQRLAERLGVPADEIATTTGSSGLLMALVLTYCGPGDEVVYAWRSFEAYPTIALRAGAIPVEVPNLPDGRHDLDAMAAAVTERTKVVLLCTPNNPTGPAITQAEFDAFIVRVPPHVVVVLDEAYLEFVRIADPIDGLAAYRTHPNVVVTRTFSKAYGLAAMRIGYAMASAAIADTLRKVFVPFGISTVAQAAAIASLDAEAELLARVDALVAERDRVTAAIAEAGWDIPDAQGNFVWLPVGADRVPALVAEADALGIVVRPLVDGVRVSIGEVEANDRLVKLAQSFSR